MNEENTKIIECACGQDSHLVLIDGAWHFKKEKHGSEELAMGCFNCHKPLKIPQTTEVKQPEIKQPEVKQPEVKQPEVKQQKVKQQKDKQP